MALPQRYEKLTQYDEDDGMKNNGLLTRATTRPPRFSFRSIGLTIVAAAVTFLLGMTIGWLASPSRAPRSSVATSNVSQCGNSTAEARALGCTFDLLAFAWWPAACLEDHAELSHTFDDWISSPERQRPWPFYYDPEGTRPVATLDELSEAVGVDIWTTPEYHVGHCSLWWRLVHLSAEGRIAANLWAGEYHHTLHCSNMLMGMRPGDFDKLGSTRLKGGAVLGWCRS